VAKFGKNDTELQATERFQMFLRLSHKLSPNKSLEPTATVPPV
jgi:hypothetical protein